MVAAAAEPRYFAPARVEGYSDAVFAIAATLLVLDLSVTALSDAQGEAAMWAALAELGPNALAFVISFGLLSLLWVIHLAQFREIRRVDTPLLWLNNVRLLFIVLIPFSTSVSAEADQFAVTRALLPVNFFLAATASAVSWYWASSRGGSLLRPESVERAMTLRRGAVSAVICGGIAAGVSPWIGSLGFLAFLLGPLVDRLVGARRRR